MSEANQFLIAFASPWVVYYGVLLLSDAWRDLQEKRSQRAAEEKRARCEADYAHAVARNCAMMVQTAATLQARQGLQGQITALKQSRAQADSERRMAGENQRAFEERCLKPLRNPPTGGEA